MRFLADVEETVVAKVLASLTNLCELGLFQKMRIWELMSATLGFLYHPNIWIREGMCYKPPANLLVVTARQSCVLTCEPKVLRHSLPPLQNTCLPVTCGAFCTRPSSTSSGRMSLTWTRRAFCWR